MQIYNENNGLALHVLGEPLSHLHIPMAPTKLQKMRISTSKYIILNQHDTVYSKANKNINLNILNVYFLIFQTSNLNLLAYYAKQDLAKHSTKGTNKSIILR